MLRGVITTIFALGRAIVPSASPEDFDGFVALQ
jgi:hypothetical protein